MKKTPLLAFLAISAVATAQQSGHPRISMVFTDTDAAYVLQAISKQTGESILYNNKNKVSVTLNLSVNSVDEAIKAVSSAASLVARRVGNIYLVATKESMKDALTPYAKTETFTLDPGMAEQIAPKIQEAVPYATVRAIGDKVSFTGIPEDLRAATDSIEEITRAQIFQKTAVTELVVMHQMNAEEAVPLIKGLYPTLEVTSTNSSKTAPLAAPTGTTGDSGVARSVQSFGAIGLRGPEAIVKSAKATIEKLETPSAVSGPNKIVISVYNLKYANGPSLATFLRKAAPELDVFVGPEQFSPQRGSITLSGSQIASGAASSQPGGGSSSSSGGGGGQAGGGAGGGAGAGAGAAAGPGGHTPQVGDRAKSIVLKGRQGDVDNALKLLTEIDVRPRQVVIDVKVIETSPTDSEKLGIDYKYSPVNFYDIPPGGLLKDAAGAVTLTQGGTQSLATGRWSRTPINFQATLSAMVSNQTAKLLAKPSIQVIDNDQGSIFIGNTIAVELSSTTQLGGVSQSIAQFPVGIILLISPRIGPDGSITVHVNPVISTVSSINADGIPQTAAREADTTMILQDGETSVLGGLIQDQDTLTISAVPWLSKIPIIGELFKSRSRTKSREDILVSITPHIVKDPPEKAK